MTIKKATIVRVAIFLFGLVNLVLTFLGYPILPFTEEQLVEGIAVGFTVITSIWTGWKNNSFTKSALVGDEAKDLYKIESKFTDEAKEEFNDSKGVEDNE